MQGILLCLFFPRRQRKPEAVRRNGRRAVLSTKEWCACTETVMIKRRRRSFRIPHLREIPLRWATAICCSGKFRLSRHRQSAVSRNFIWTSSGNSPFEQIPSGQAPAIRCLRKTCLNEQRRFAAHRNCARASTGTLPLGEIALVRASAFRRFKKFRLGKENPIGWRPLLRQRSSTRTGFYGKSSGQGKPDRVEAAFAPAKHRPNRFLQKLRSGKENPIG